MKYYLLLALLLMSGAHLDAANTAYQIVPSTYPIPAKALIPFNIFAPYEPTYYYTEERSPQNGDRQPTRHMLLNIPEKHVNACKSIYFPEANSRDATYDRKMKYLSWWKGLSLVSMVAGLAAFWGAYHSPAFGLAEFKSIAVGSSFCMLGLFGFDHIYKEMAARNFKIITIRNQDGQPSTGLWLRHTKPLSYTPKSSYSNDYSAPATQLNLMSVQN